MFFPEDRSISQMYLKHNEKGNKQNSEGPVFIDLKFELFSGFMKVEKRFPSYVWKRKESALNITLGNNMEVKLNSN